MDGCESDTIKAKALRDAIGLQIAVSCTLHVSCNRIPGHAGVSYSVPETDFAADPDVAMASP